MASYATPAELRAIGLGGKTATTGPSTDANLQIALDAATDAINGLCNRPDGFTAISIATSRVYNGSGTAFQWIDECTSISLVEVKNSPSDSTYVAWSASDWIPFSGDPKYPDFNRLPYTALMVAPNGTYAHFVSGSFVTWPSNPPESTTTRGAPTVRVTATWGYAAIAPARVKQACIAQAARWVKRGEGAWNDALASANMGTLLYTKELDPDVAMMLVKARLVRPAIGRR